MVKFRVLNVHIQLNSNIKEMGPFFLNRFFQMNVTLLLFGVRPSDFEGFPAKHKVLVSELFFLVRTATKSCSLIWVIFNTVAVCSVELWIHGFVASLTLKKSSETKTLWLVGKRVKSESLALRVRSFKNVPNMLDTGTNWTFLKYPQKTNTETFENFPKPHQNTFEVFRTTTHCL